MGKTRRKTRTTQVATIVDPARILLAAERIWKGNELIAKQMNQVGDVTLAEPLVVTGALALELYFKCLYAIEHNGRTIRGHDLYVLFSNLSQESRAAIKDEYDRLLPQNPTRAVLRRAFEKQVGTPPDEAIESVLRGAANAFELWRYPFEGVLSSFTGCLEIRDASRLRIIQLKPEYAAVRDSRSPWKKIGEEPLPLTFKRATIISPEPGPKGCPVEEGEE
ncbi:MAG: hypothetical protein HY699_04490 [Deltaproteobacteria bacterium]|nr:hypothetical protein [Deltaproteobacteria bacterium]